jgi:hypothetical protein
MTMPNVASFPKRIAWLALLAAQAAGAATDGVFIESTPEPSTAPSYESGYAADARRHGLGNSTPEADARPGEVFYLQAAEAFRKHDYVLAEHLYEVSASWAFKPAQYNLGVMYARGQGVQTDLPRAMAWMALASERGDPHYVEAREAVYALLSKEQFDEANVLWREMKKTYGDEVALRRAKARWAQVKAGMTGSRVGSAGNLSVGVPNQNGGVTQGPKIVVAGGATGKPQNNAHAEGSHAGPTTAGEVLGGAGVDGSIAYKQLRESDNPYDPKFSTANGISIVGPPEPAGEQPEEKKADETAKVKKADGGGERKDP